MLQEVLRRQSQGDATQLLGLQAERARFELQNLWGEDLLVARTMQGFSQGIQREVARGKESMYVMDIVPGRDTNGHLQDIWKMSEEQATRKAAEDLPEFFRGILQGPALKVVEQIGASGVCPVLLRVNTTNTGELLPTDPLMIFASWDNDPRPIRTVSHMPSLENPHING